MNPIAGNFDAARWKEVAQQAKQLADIAEEQRPMTKREQLKTAIGHLPGALKELAIYAALLFLAVSILTIPLKLIYTWGCFLWNLL
jgi:hypothetical protein